MAKKSKETFEDLEDKIPDFVFPIDIEKTVYKGEVTYGQKVAAAMTFITIVFIIGYVNLIKFTSLFGIPNIVTASVLLTLLLIAFFNIYRVFIFKEEDRLLQRENDQKDSIYRFYKFRNINRGDSIKVGKVVVPMYQFKNGSYAFVLNLKFGSNDDGKSRGAEFIIEKIIKESVKNNLEVRQYIVPEDVSRAKEILEEQINLTNIEDKKTAETYKEIFFDVIKTSREKSNVDEIYFYFKTTGLRKKFELDYFISSTMQSLTTIRHPFRSYKFIEKDEMNEFLKNMYALEIMDETLLKERKVILRDVKVYKLVSESGRVFIKDSAISDSLPQEIPLKKRG